GPARAPPDQDAARRPPHQDRRSPASGRARSWSSRVNVSIPALGGQLLPGVQVPRVSLTERVGVVEEPQRRELVPEVTGLIPDRRCPETVRFVTKRGLRVAIGLRLPRAQGAPRG